MPPIPSSHNATRAEVASWLTMSRNLVVPFLERFGIMPLSGKYPMARIYTHVLGATPADDGEAEMLGQGMVRLGDVADRVGRGAGDLLNDLRQGKGGYPPLYVFGPRQHLFLRGQIDQMMVSPRNSWQALPHAKTHAVRAPKLAQALNATKADVDLLLADRNDLPAHYIIKGAAKFIVYDARRRLAKPAEQVFAAPEPTPLPSLEQPKGIMARALLAGNGVAAVAPRTTPDRPRTCPGAREGDSAHGKPPEAKLSGI